MKRITILGSTGSIGRNALDIIARYRDRFEVVVLTAGDNINLLKKQIERFSPKLVALASEKAAEKLKKRLKKYSLKIDILYGSEGISEAAAYKGSDFVLSAIVGAAGLIPTLSAIRAGKTIGLANKETLVMAGKLLIEESMKAGVTILPVDSEHSAIFQCVEGYKKSQIKRIILTASGGPFAGKKKRYLEGISPKEALKHPSWKMGKKITIDSATLMNKGFEVIEAHYLFGIPPDRIDVLIHPESIIHSMVEFIDGSYMAQLSVPDMKGPIAYALTYPDRLENVLRELNLGKIRSLNFKRPDIRSFPCLSYAYKALKVGGTMPAVMNAANEVAVNAFLKGEIKFTDIPVIINKTMKAHEVVLKSNLDIIMEADAWARGKAEELIKD